MKKVWVMAFLAVFARGVSAEGLPEIDWVSLKSQPVKVLADDVAAQGVLAKVFKEQEGSRLRLEAKSFYNVLYQQQGLPRQRYSLSDALAGKEIDRTKFHYATCGIKIDNTAGKALANSTGVDVGLRAAAIPGTLNSAEMAGVGVIVGVVSALATSQEKVLSCEEEVTVCPLSASFCTWHESVVTDFTLYDGDKAVAESKRFVARDGRGFEPKELATKHLQQLEAL